MAGKNNPEQTHPVIKNYQTARSSIESLADSIRNGQSPEARELEKGLDDLFRAIKDIAIAGPSGTLTENQLDSLLGARREVLEIWDDLSEIHLPVSLALLRGRILNSDGATTSPALRYGRDDKSAAQTEGKPPVLLLMTGFSVEQLVLCIAVHYFQGNVRRVVPFAGKLKDGGTTWNNTAHGQILAGLQAVGISVRQRATVRQDEVLQIDPPTPVDASDPAGVFREILRWSRLDGNKQCRCALDVTGGQKPMDSGASYAAMFLGWPAYYLDFAVYDPKLRRPEPQSLRYTELQLPSSAFAHRTRELIVELFSKNRFSSALEYLNDLDLFTKESKFFNDDERGDIGKAKSLLTLCNAWMSADYFGEAMSSSSDPVSLFFQRGRDRGNGADRAGLDQKELGRKLNELLDAPNATPRDVPLLEYAIHEYWRIVSAYEVSHDSRECLVGTHGLAEILVDGVLHLHQFPLRIERIFSAVSYPGKDQLPAVLDRDDVAALLERKAVPVSRLPPSAAQQKRDLLLKGSCNFDLWLPRLGDDHSKLFEWMTGPAEVDSKNFIEVSAEILLANDDRLPAVTSEAGAALSNTQQGTHWGGYPWFRLRNLTAHWRAPLGEGFHDVVNNALEEWLPRYLGLYSLAVESRERTPTFKEKACHEAGKRRLGEGTCRPWHDKRQVLQDWLRLR